MFAREFGFRPKLSARLEFWEEWLLVEGLEREYSESGASSEPTETRPATPEQLASLGIEVE